MTGVKVKNRRAGRAWKDGQAETADAADAAMRAESRKATEKYRLALIAAGHLVREGHSPEGPRPKGLVHEWPGAEGTRP